MMCNVIAFFLKMCKCIQLTEVVCKSFVILKKSVLLPLIGVWFISTLITYIKSNKGMRVVTVYAVCNENLFF